MSKNRERGDLLSFESYTPVKFEQDNKIGKRLAILVVAVLVFLLVFSATGSILWAMFAPIALFAMVFVFASPILFARCLINIAKTALGQPPPA